MKKIFVTSSLLLLLLGCAGENTTTLPGSDELVEGGLMTQEEMQEIDEDYALVRELEDLEEVKKEGSRAIGSCDDIAGSSICTEYYGSFWTNQIIEMGCEGAGFFSEGPCPEGMSGGCNTGVGTPADMIVWMYLSGGGDMTAASMKHASSACNATMASKWVQK
jgi:hypothetical protein